MNERITASIDRCKKHGGEVCIQVDKIYDSCRDKECLENLRVYLTQSGQNTVDRAINIKPRKAEVIWVFSDVEQVPFNRGFYTVDLKFFFKVTLDAFTGIQRPTTVEGLATFDKKVVLFGSEGNSKIFQSIYKPDSFDTLLWKKTNMPKAVVEVVDPITLGAKIVDICDHHCRCEENEIEFTSIPESIHRVFDEVLVLDGENKRVYVSLGLFSIIKLERNVQILIPSHEFCIPENECIAATDDNPCELFERIKFPIDEFFPPQREDFESAEGFFNDTRTKYQD